jgi:hypothetical protein
VLSLRGGWLFVHVPKTGGNSLQWVLHPHSDDRLVARSPRDGVEDFAVAGPVTPRKHASLAEYEALLPAEVFSSLFVFSITRDPWERAISQYFGPVRRQAAGGAPDWSPARFLSFLDRVQSVAGMTSLRGRNALDFTLRFDRLAEDAAELFRRLGLPPAELPHRNRGLAPRPWRSYYEEHPELVEAVASRFADDVALFGYHPPLDVSPSVHAR